MHTGNPARTRLSWLLVTLLALPLLVGQGVSAQDVTPAPIASLIAGPYVDMSVYCADVGTLTSGPSASADAGVGLIPISDGKSVLVGEWDMPAGSFLTLKGEAALLEVEEGLVMVVSCGAPLEYATEPGPEPGDLTYTELPADMGLQIDPTFEDGIFLSYAEHSGTVAIVAQAEGDSQITLQVVGSTENEGVCTATDCWDWTDVAPATETPSVEETPMAGLASPIAGPPVPPRICGWYRC